MAETGRYQAWEAAVGSEIDDAYLVQRAREGYVDAYAELVDRHGQLAYRVALRLLGNHHDAEDVAQEALVTAWQQLPGFKANSRFSTWLYQIVTRKTLNRITRTRATQSLDLLGDIAATGDEPAQQTERDLTVDAVTAAVDRPAAAAAHSDRLAPLRGTVQRRDRPHHRQHSPGRP